MSSDLSLVHLIVGVGSPTELQGRRTSFIQGVVTFPPNDRILAGTAYIQEMRFGLNIWSTDDGKYSKKTLKNSCGLPLTKVPFFKLFHPQLFAE